MSISSNRIIELQNFIEPLGLSFSDYSLLDKALTHSSYAYEQGCSRFENYERLEFLGDAVLKLAISDILYNEYPEKTEGELSAQRAFIVSDKNIAEYSKKLNIRNFILTGKCEKDNFKGMETIFACAFEAFLGAIYLEYKEKGFEKAKVFLLENFKEEILKTSFVNAKAQLQEYTQKLNHDRPEYVILGNIGPAHNRTFTIGVYYRGNFISKGTANSKKEAEAEGAKEALIKLKEIYGE